jgi:hypothetical protein
MNMLGNKQEYLQAVPELSLDELFEIASEVGSLETGGTWGRQSASIKVHGTGHDYISVSSSDKPNLKANIQECIAKAHAIRQLY